MSAVKIATLLLLLLALTYTQPGPGGPPGGRRPPPPTNGAPPPNGGQPPNGQPPSGQPSTNPPPQTQPTNVGGQTGLPTVNSRATFAENATIKIKVLIKIFRIARELGINMLCSVKEFLKKAPLNRLQNILEKLQASDRPKMSNIYEFLQFLKEQGVRLPFPFVFVPPCKLGQTPTRNSQAPLVNGCWQNKFWDKTNFDLSQNFGDCCSQHDQCYGQCHYPSYISFKQNCDIMFKQCMKSKCDGDEECEDRVYDVIEITEEFGWEVFNKAQEKHCSCQ